MAVRQPRLIARGDHDQAGRPEFFYQRHRLGVDFKFNRSQWSDLMRSLHAHLVQHAITLNEYTDLHEPEQSINLADRPARLERDIFSESLSKNTSDSSQK